jgi:hypothetical protein
MPSYVYRINKDIEENVNLIDLALHVIACVVHQQKVFHKIRHNSDGSTVRHSVPIFMYIQ